MGYAVGFYSDSLWGEVLGGILKGLPVMGVGEAVLSENVWRMTS